MIIYLVYIGDYSDKKLLGAYSTKELADLAGEERLRYFDPYVEEVVLDEHADLLLAGLRRYMVSFTEPGELEDRPSVVDLANGAPKTYGYQNGRVTVQCDARDEAHAIKIASDERARYLASHA